MFGQLLLKMNDLIKNKDFLSARKGNKHFVFRNTNLSRPSWNDILNELSRTVSSKERYRELDKFSLILLKAENIPHVQPLMSSISSLSNLQCSAHCYINFVTHCKTFGRHNDDSDVFFWQVQGSTKWVVEEQQDFVYILNENDLIYIPRKIVHTVFPLTPRVGISIGLDYEC